MVTLKLWQIIVISLLTGYGLKLMFQFCKGFKKGVRKAIGKKADIAERER